MVAEPDFVASATSTALMVTTGGLGTFAGAVYSPVGSMVPTLAFPPARVSTSQLTAVLEEFCTVALNCAVAPVTTVAAGAATCTVAAGGGSEGAAALPPPPQDTRKGAMARTVSHTKRGGPQLPTAVPRSPFADRLGAVRYVELLLGSQEAGDEFRFNYPKDRGK